MAAISEMSFTDKIPVIWESEWCLVLSNSSLLMVWFRGVLLYIIFKANISTQFLTFLVLTTN